jgi:hypothetical protein
MRAGKFCFAMLVAGVVAAGCSSASTIPPGYNGADYQAPAASQAALPAAGGVSGGELIPAGPTAAATDAAAAPGSAGGAGNASVIEDQIIKTGTIKVQVASIDDAIARATDQIHALGGWLAGSDRAVDSTSQMGSVTYRIPVAQFENALAAMRKFGTQVLYEHTDSTQVGGKIVDLKAQIINLQASEKAIQGVMNKATTITDILTVQQRLSDVQGQIEELSGQLNGITDQAAYSTLTVQFVIPYTAPTASPSPSPSPSPTPSPTPIPWSAADQAGQAGGSLRDVGETGATALIWIVILFLPIAIVSILAFLLLVWAARWLDAYRRRLLPFTNAVPAANAWGQRPPYSGQVQNPPASGPVEPPKP